LGYPAEKFVQDPYFWLSLVHPDDREAVRQDLAAAVAGGSATILEYRMLASDGRVVWVRDESRVVQDGPESPPYLQGVMSDITAERMAHDALRQSDERFRAAIDGSFDAFSIVQAERDAAGEIVDFRFVEANQRCAELVGTTVPGMVGRSLRALLPETTYPSIFEQYCEVVRTGQGFNAEFSIVRDSGERAWRRHQAVPLGDGIAITWADITEQKLAEQRSVAAEARYRDLVEHIPAATYLQAHDDDAAVLFIAPQIEQMLGYSPDEWIATPDLWLRLVHPDDRERVRAEHMRTNATGEPFRMEYRMLARDGRIVWLLDDGQLVRDADGEPMYWQGVFLDITAQAEAEELRREAERRYQSLVEHMPAVIFVEGLDEGSTNLYVSPQVEALLGYPSEDWHGDGSFWRSVLHPDDRERVVAEYRRARARRAPFTAEYRMVAADGRTVWVRDRSGVVCDAEGRPLYVQRVWLDITDRKQAEALLAEREEYFRSLVQNSTELTVVINDNGTITYVTPSVRSILGYSVEEALALGPTTLIHPDDRERVQALIEHAPAGGPLLMRAMHADGSWRHLELLATNLRDNPVVRGVVVNCRDVTDRVRFEEELERRAFYDVLTGLPNRLLFNQRLEHALARAVRTGETHAVLFLDLDRFKVVNDSLGHVVGDALLLQFAGRLVRSVRDTDTVARLGGDEFIILLESVAHPDDAIDVAERIISTLRAPFDLVGQEVFVTGSVGIAISDGEQRAADDLLRMADIALYRAKADGRAGYAVYNQHMNVYSVDQVALEADLQHVVQREQLRVHYQPEWDLSTGEIIGAEALVRWQHPQRGLVPPSEFIPLAEETGQILAIGQWVLYQACRQAREWQECFGSFAPKVLSVNLSARQFQRGGLVDDVAGALRCSGLAPEHLRLEITESVIVQDVQATAETLRALRDLGVRLAIDDFGTGYSSLSYLARLAVDVVKVDKSFVNPGPTERLLARDEVVQSDAIVRAVAAMAHELGMRVTAEGIETDDQAERMRAAGCDAGQGYYFSRPVPADQFAALLAARVAAGGRALAAHPMLDAAVAEQVRYGS
ncbi:MAG: hypothetical protein DCC58_19540, partial [Chloroflexi bacterium]